MRKFFRVLTCLLFFFANFNTCAAEDLKFIDSEDDVGYFVDLDSVKIESNDIFVANLAIIRIKLNQMDVVDLRINHREQNYTVRSIQTLSYDERTVLKSDNQQRTPQTYSDKSWMGDLVKIVINGGDL